MSSAIEQCDAIVTEALLAWRLCCPEGEMFSGKHLLAWRELPELERRYFAALVEPYVDPHALTRVRTATEVSSNECRFTYEPPYPEPCSCERPVWVDHYGGHIRCSRCLAAWSLKSAMVNRLSFTGLRDPINEVSKVDIGFATERILAARREHT